MSAPTPNSPPVVAFAAPSGTGKTTVLEQLTTLLERRGLVVGAIKSDAHRVELDTPGKDTHRMRKAGAATTAIVSKDQVALFNDRGTGPIPLPTIITAFFEHCDLVLLEGFRSLGYPTVLVHREAVSQANWTAPGSIIAVVSDASLNRDGVPTFRFDELGKLAALLLRSTGLGEAAP